MKRNDKCKCGSGKKVKNCCMAKMAQLPAEYIAERLADKTPKACLLCGDIATRMGVWAWSDKLLRERNGPINKNRYCFYFLCQECMTSPDHIELVEKKILDTATEKDFENVGQPKLYQHEIN